jgi:MFS family permease
MTTVAAAVFAVQAAGAAALPQVGGSLAWAAVCITAFGLGFGVATIARPAILADRYGTHRYATIAATTAVPMTLAKAGAPLAAAALGNNQFLRWAAGACLLAAVLLWASRRRSPANQKIEPHPGPSRQTVRGLEAGRPGGAGHRHGPPDPRPDRRLG